MSRPQIRAFLEGLLVQIYQPQNREPLGHWAESHITLSHVESQDLSGPYRRDVAPHIPRLLDCFFDDAQWRYGWIAKSSQCGLSLHVLMKICRQLGEDPINILFSAESAGKAAELSTRLGRLVADCPTTKKLVQDHAEEMHKNSWHLPTANLHFVGGGSAGQAASHPCTWAINDEVEKYKAPASEAPLHMLFAQRIKRARRGKHLAFSTPTTEDGPTLQGYALGSQHQLFVPCPHCSSAESDYFTLELPQLKFRHCRGQDDKWDYEALLHDTYYECPHCKKRIDEAAKPAMNEAGQWRATHFDPETEKPLWIPGNFSARVTDLHSTVKGSRWGDLALEFVTSYGDPGKIQNFFNGRMATAPKLEGGGITPELVLKLKGAYSRLNLTPGKTTAVTLPFDPALTVLASDIQGDVLKWAIVAFDRQGNAYLLDWGASFVLEDLDALANSSIPLASGGFTRADIVGIDDGYQATAVRRFCRGRFPRFVPLKGATASYQTQSLQWRKVHVEKKGRSTIPLLLFHDRSFKIELYLQRIRDAARRGPEMPGPPRLFIPKDPDESILRELSGEQWERDEKKNNWDFNQYPPNDWGDAVKMALVLFAEVKEKLVKEGRLEPLVG